MVFCDKFRKVFPIQASNINNFHLEVLSGQAESYITYFVGATEVQNQPQNDQLKIQRTFRKVKGDGKDIKIGDIVEVKIHFDLNDHSSPPGRYIISDYLPAGLKYLENPSIFGLVSEGWANHQDQVVTFYFCNSAWWRKYTTNYFSYFARAGSVGTYTAEPAVIQSQQELSIFRTTEADKITIEPAN